MKLTSSSSKKAKPTVKAKNGSSIAPAKKGKVKESNQISDLGALLKSAGLKYTQGRAQVFMSLIESDVPLTVESIIKDMKEASPDRATVYRILEQFERAALVKQIHFNDGVVRYEIVGLEGHDHCCHHVICKGCGTIEHVESDEVEKALKTMMKKIKNFPQVDEHTLQFFGYCSNCTL